MRIRLVILFLGLCSLVFGQNAAFVISGKILELHSNALIEGANIYVQGSNTGTISDAEGQFLLKPLSPADYNIVVSFLGKKTIVKSISFTDRNVDIVFYLEDDEEVLSEITILGKEESQAIERLKAVEETGIYASKKTEVVVLDKLVINKTSNISRQIYAKVAGLNIWESDGAGVQLGIGGRGLSPNRNSNFNTKQNGYDISADALGYPESYYTPPVDAIDRIEVIRGAASLQYGTQFGGMLNFRFKEGSKLKKIETLTKVSTASFGFRSLFNSLSGTVGKLNYYSFYQYKEAGGWRSNSSLEQHNGFVGLNWQVSEKFRLKTEYTHSNYLAQQPGGLTDVEFEMDPRQSKRERNWFAVDWNLFAINIDYKFNDNIRWNNRLFGLLAGRDALGNLDNINLLDFGENRDFLSDDFNNWGNESRLFIRYPVNDLPATLLLGVRYYKGRTLRKQGEGSNGSGPDFGYLNPNNLEGSDFILPSTNTAIFAENVFNLSDQFSITPGARFEHIRTATSGYYREVARDLAGNILNDERIIEDLENKRMFMFFGLGLSYKINPETELYANLSQNYRAINFNDIRINVGSLVVDENLKDENGYTFDLGLRGSLGKVLSFDNTIYHISYKDRIGTILKKEPNPVFNGLVDRVIRFRTNIADASIYGVESLLDLDLAKVFNAESEKYNLNLFTNFSWTYAAYKSTDTTIDGNEVELVPTFTFKSGVTFGIESFEASLQYSFTDDHFSDASNAIRTPTAIEGLIPAYNVTDLSLGYSWKRFKIETGCNNMLNQAYFTRRATGYPGPGIIPSDGRSIYLSLSVTL
ncbi:MAG: Fe(3+) dicitrate transport protein [Saprospiraceae bacterium]|jgi:Fe(3+) dicitrate transport protein